MVTEKWKSAFVGAWDAPEGSCFDVDLRITQLSSTWHYWYGARRCYPSRFAPGFRRHRQIASISVSRGVESHRALGRPRSSSGPEDYSLIPGLITLHHPPAAGRGRPARRLSQGQSRGRVKNASMRALTGLLPSIFGRKVSPTSCDSNERRLAVREVVVFD